MIERLRHADDRGAAQTLAHPWPAAVAGVPLISRVVREAGQHVDVVSTRVQSGGEFPQVPQGLRRIPLRDDQRAEWFGGVRHEKGSGSLSPISVTCTIFP